VLVRYLADQRRGGQDGFWMSIYYDRWDPNQPGGRSMSDASLDHLWDLANTAKEDRFVRDAALGIWLNAVREDRLEQIRSVPQDATNYRTSLQRRTEFGDIDVVPSLVQSIDASPWLLYKAHRVWCPLLRQAVDSLLKSLGPAVCTRSPSEVDEISHDVSHLLMRIPRTDAEQLISSNWPDVSHLHYLVLAALYIGTSRCLELADQAIKQSPPGSEPLSFVTHMFGIGTIPDQDFLEPRHFEALRPYLKLIDKPHLGWIAEGCQRLGLASWSREYIMPLLDDERRERHFPTDEQLLEWLDRLLEDVRAHGVYGVEIWLRGFEERHDPTDRALVVLDRWLSENRTADALEIVAAALRRMGKRSTLSLLDKYEVAGPTDVVNRIKENARFAIRTRSLD